jgi:hypothetical protein
MISEDIRFVAGEDIKKGDVVKYVERIGIVKAGSGFVDDPMRGRVLIPEPRAVVEFPRGTAFKPLFGLAGRANASPYNAKPVPRFEVSEEQSGPFAGWFKVILLVDDKEVDFLCVSRTWFRRNQERAIKKAQLRMVEDYAMTRRLSGSVETLTGVRLV